MKQETQKHQSSQPGTQDGERCDSEFIRRAQAFASYMAKEYAEPADGDIAMLLLAIDATGAEKTASLHCTMGSRMRIAADIADMMHDKKWGRDLFRNARIMAGGDEGATDELLRRNRRRLRIDYAVLALPIIMVIFTTALAIVSPTYKWTDALGVAMLMGTDILLIVRDILDRRRQIARILAERHSEDKDRAEAAAKTFFDMLRRRMNDDDDE
jgi:hypothetical protein